MPRVLAAVCMHVRLQAVLGRLFCFLVLRFFMFYGVSVCQVGRWAAAGTVL